MDYKNEYYQDLPEYNGKTKFDVLPVAVKGILLLTFLFFTLFVSFAILDDYIDFNSIRNSMPGIGIFALLVIVFSFVTYSSTRKIIVSKEGIIYINNANQTHRFFLWKDIKVIGVSSKAVGLRNAKHFLYISTEHLEDDIVIKSYYEGPSMIVSKLDPKLAHCLLKYWNKDIKNLDAMKSWKRYIDKL